jgi:energy-coupling factor transport system ATP-binding protein
MCRRTQKITGGIVVVIEIKNLTHTYMPGTAFSKTAIKDINLTISQGEFIGLIGHSGSGKSTLIQHLNGLIKGTEGVILNDGEDIFKNKETLKQVRFKVGLVFQYPEAQLFEETVFDDIAFGPKNIGLPKEEIEKRVYEAAELTGIKPELLKKSPFDLSGGQKRRVAIAGVVAMQPEVLILDEPTAGLDPKGRNNILKKIKELHKKTNMTVILVSHSMEDIANNVDRIIVMNKGKIAMDGTKDEVFAKSDELERIGLSVPMVTKVFKELKKSGYNVPDNVYTIDRAKEIIKSLVKEAKN